MKLRIKGNTVRLRLSKSEIDTFIYTGSIQEKTQFVNSIFNYIIKVDENIANINATFETNQLTVYIPAKMVHEWASTNLVGMEYNLPVGNNNFLFILVEKDFKCIDGDLSEDQSDYFENPAKAC